MKRTVRNAPWIANRSTFFWHLASCQLQPYRVGGKPSTGFPLGTRSTDNFSNGSFKCFLLGKAIQIWNSWVSSISCEKSDFLKYSSKYQHFRKERRMFKTNVSSSIKALCNFKIIFTLYYNFYKLQYVLHKTPWIHEHSSWGKNCFFIARCMCVQPHLLSRFAMKRAVNRQPGYRSGNSKGKSPPHCHFQIFFWVVLKFQKKNFFEKFGSYRTLIF